MITTVIFDYGGVISGPLFVGIGEFEAEMGYPRGAFLQLMFGETHYIGVEGRGVAAQLADEARTELADAIDADPDAVEDSGVLAEPDWHLLEKGEIDFGAYLERVSARAPAILGKDLDLAAYGRFMQSSAPGVHWMVVHKIRELKDRGFTLGLLTNNVKQFGEHWRATFPIEWFDEVVDSSHVGMRKPDREIYELTCERMAIAPSDAVFVDDNLDNIAGARTFGLHAVHFTADPWASLAELEALLPERR